MLPTGCHTKFDAEIFGHLPPEEFDKIKVKLDELHKHKIDLADEVLVMNVGNYIGKSTRLEIEYAKTKNKLIRYLEPV